MSLLDFNKIVSIQYSGIVESFFINHLFLVLLLNCPHFEIIKVFGVNPHMGTIYY